MRIIDKSEPNKNDLDFGDLLFCKRDAESEDFEFYRVSSTGSVMAPYALSFLASQPDDKKGFWSGEYSTASGLINSLKSQFAVVQKVDGDFIIKRKWNI